MAIVVRVKRRRNDCQPQSLEFTCKKLKFDEEITEEDHLKNIFKFAGTIDTKDSKPLHVVKQAIGKEKLKKEYLKYKSEPVIKSRNLRKQLALESRYKIISKKRAANFDELEIENVSEANPEAKYQLIDIETENEDVATTSYIDNDDITCNGVMMTKSRRHDGISDIDDGSYVYDLFYTNNKCLDFNALENILKIEAYREEFLYMGYGEDDDDEMMLNDDEDDENDENNWRNDYPDEDPKYYDSLDENQDYEDDEATGYGFDVEGNAEMAASNDLSEYISESTEHALKDTLIVRGMMTTFQNFYR